MTHSTGYVRALVRERGEKFWQRSLTSVASSLLEELGEGAAADPARFIPITLTGKQSEFDRLDCREALYGGAAGGGKSVAMLATALRYVHIPGYSALLLRRSYSHLTLDGSLIPMSQEWLRGTGASWNGEHNRWTFPSGATLTFGYLDHPRHLDRYQGAQFQFIGFDELTQFPESHYRYLFSRLRKPATLDVPLRMRATANPGGIGHEWVKQRFLVEGPGEGRVFIPAKLDDNPHLEREQYVLGLMELDPATRKRLLDGDWDAIPEGDFFKRPWFRIIEPSDVPGGMQWVRFWDPAGTDPKPGTDPDWTCGALVGLRGGQWFIRDMRRMRGAPDKVEMLVRDTANEDGRTVHVYMEQEPGSSGKAVISHYARNVLPGFTFRGVRSTGPKTTRAAPVASAAEQGNVFLVRGEWLTPFLDEAAAFPHGAHDDQVDAVSGAVSVLRPKLAKIGKTVTRMYAHDEMSGLLG